ncbi:MAG: hypothetical protein Q7S74_06535 [Nanoarchaeota archaeon]|nr:hypothetical protein [Nanoarchaeota archaeon]
MVWKDSVSYMRDLNFLDPSLLLSCLALYDVVETQYRLSFRLELKQEEVVKVLPSFILTGGLQEKPYDLCLNKKGDIVRRVESTISSSQGIEMSRKTVGAPDFSDLTLFAENFAERLPLIANELEPVSYNSLGFSITKEDCERLQYQAVNKFYDCFSGYITDRFLWGTGKYKVTMENKHDLHKIIDPLVF